MINKKSGFTLMEIMVVIIVIAVLASVAGPMIGSITDQGRASATKSKLSSLKSALLAYQSDVGRLPFTGNAKSVNDTMAYDAATLLNYSCADLNVLTSNSHNGTGAKQMNISNYGRKWKGPYMDSDPSDFMYDSWGNPIRYIGKGHNVYLWSYGPDGTPGDNGAGEDPGAALTNSTEKEDKDDIEDDIVISIARVKKEIKGTSIPSLDAGSTSGSTGGGD